MAIRTHLAYAYPRKARENLHGRVHLVVDGPLDHGRLHRQQGDALCKPSREFWGLTSGEDDLCGNGITCTPCTERYDRLVAAGVLAPHEGKVDGPRATLDPVHGGVSVLSGHAVNVSWNRTDGDERPMLYCSYWLALPDGEVVLGFYGQAEGWPTVAWRHIADQVPISPRPTHWAEIDVPAHPEATP